MIGVIWKHTLKYFSAGMFASIISFLMIKYYTAVFSPKEYGILSMYLVD